MAHTTFIDANGKERYVSDLNPLPVDIQGATLSLDTAGVEIANDIGNPIPTIGGFALPPYDEFELDDPGTPTEILYKKDGELVATVTLAYDVGGGLISGAITYPAEA